VRKVRNGLLGWMELNRLPGLLYGLLRRTDGLQVSCRMWGELILSRRCGVERSEISPSRMSTCPWRTGRIRFCLPSVELGGAVGGGVFGALVAWKGSGCFGRGGRSGIVGIVVGCEVF